MNNDQLQDVLSLSAVSYVGPLYDVMDLTGKGFYKKKTKENMDLDLHISMFEEPFNSNSKAYDKMIKTFNIKDNKSYGLLMEELLKGWELTKAFENLFQITKLLSQEERLKKKAIATNGYVFSYKFYQKVKIYEFHIGKRGLMAYDLANMILLLRLGVNMDYIAPTKQMDYLEKVLEKVESNFDSFRQFGEEAIIGRNIHLLYKELESNQPNPEKKDGLLSVAYYSIWNHLIEMEKENIFHG